MSSTGNLIVAQDAQPRVASAAKEILIGPRSKLLLQNGRIICNHASMLILPPDSTERKIAIHVLLRLTRMDVCCGPPLR
jgi:hypothetical protein